MDSIETAVRYTCGFQISQDRGDQEKKSLKRLNSGTLIEKKTEPY